MKRTRLIVFAVASAGGLAAAFALSCARDSTCGDGGTIALSVHPCFWEENDAGAYVRRTDGGLGGDPFCTSGDQYERCLGHRPGLTPVKLVSSATAPTGEKLCTYEWQTDQCGGSDVL